MSFEIPNLENLTESKRIYRCPNCDAMILESPDYSAIHYCSCRAITHIKNWKIEFEVA